MVEQLDLVGTLDEDFVHVVGLVHQRGAVGPCLLLFAPVGPFHGQAGDDVALDADEGLLPQRYNGVVVLVQVVGQRFVRHVPVLL
jgi:hypothetical protein